LGKWAIILFPFVMYYSEDYFLVYWNGFSFYKVWTW